MENLLCVRRGKVWCRGKHRLTKQNCPSSEGKSDTIQVTPHEKDIKLGTKRGLNRGLTLDQGLGATSEEVTYKLRPQQ